jgi:3-hydroxy-5-phosphonooxypentane-2,4-dione thiolase
MNGKEIRLSRLFSEEPVPSLHSGQALNAMKDQKTVVVAIDHGQTFGPTEGLVQFMQAAERLGEANGVLLAAHMIRHSGSLFSGAGSPVCITRLNWNTIHCEPWQYREANIVKTLSVKDAVRLGAEIVLASLTLQTGSEEHDSRNVEVFARAVEDANDLGIPVIGEVFPVGGLRPQAEAFHDYIQKMCRIIAELGADAIKTFYTGEQFSEVVQGTPVPVFALGAEKFKNESDALQLAWRAVQAGAAGVVFGRNVIQARNPAQFLRALKAVVQAQATPEEAVAEYQLL